MRSARWIVDSRWATTIVVRPDINESRARSTMNSVPGSRLLLASSSTSTAGSTNAARASDTNWRSPADSREPRSRTSVWMPSGNSSKRSSAPIASKAARMSSSPALDRATRTLSATVPPNRNPSWGTTTTRWRSDAIVASRRSTPPNEIVPSVGSYRRAISFASVDLPAPVGPTSASRSPSATVIDTSLNTGVSVAGYRNPMASTTSSPHAGSSRSPSSMSGTVSRMPNSLLGDEQDHRDDRADRDDVAGEQPATDTDDDRRGHHPGRFDETEVPGRHLHA